MSSFGSIHSLRCPTPKKKVCNFVGGVLSPLLANIALHGLEDVVKKAGRPVFGRKNVIRIYQNTLCIRYADDCAPRARRRLKEPPECATVPPLRGGPSEPAGRSRCQTTSGGCGPKPWS